MNISSAAVLYFSGTGTTERYVKEFARALPYETQTKQLTAYEAVVDPLGASDLLVLAVPVYAGFAPAFVWDALKDLKGESTPCVLLAVYGARDYDNALLEMSGKLADKGFVTVAAAGLVARHSIVNTVASDRPTSDDLDGVRAFADTVAKRIAGLASIEDAPDFAFKGEMGTGPKLGMVPQASDACIMCGTCAMECPARAIPEDAPNTTDADACISCLRCIEVCPTDARSLPAELVAGLSAKLAQSADSAKANEYF